MALSEKPYFHDLRFSVYGTGPLFNPLTSMIHHFPNVSVMKKMLTPAEISRIHKENGIMLIPTRQDSQGVTMCEAMSSGLVPVTSNNTAIPEFVNHNHSGMLCDNRYIAQFVEAIEHLYMNYDMYRRMSRNAGDSIGMQCDARRICAEELTFAEELVGGNDGSVS